MDGAKTAAPPAAPGARRGMASPRPS